jgi:FkbM family methyltransferase
MADKALRLLIDKFAIFLFEEIEKGRPLAFYGASLLGRKVLLGAKKQNLQVDYFVDKNWKRLPSEINGVRVISPQKAKELNCIIFVTSSFYNEILIDVKGEFDCIFYHAIGCWVLFDKITEILQLYDSLANDASREIMYNLISYYIGKANRPIKSGYAQYLHPAMNRKGVRTIVDGGAYDGDTVGLFRHNFGSDARILAFEPNLKLAEFINSKVGNVKNTIVIEKGLWHTDTKLPFASGNGYQQSGGCVDESGDEHIEAVALDNIAGGEQVDFFKLDVEGAEPFALEGARQTIRRDMPNCAICIYHNWEDWLTVHAFMKEELSKHRLYLGHHTDFVEETVLYTLRPE